MNLELGILVVRVFFVFYKLEWNLLVIRENLMIKRYKYG